MSAIAAVRLTVTGVVQGVGFRPFVHRLALRHHLAGRVRNVTGRVEIDVEGESREVAAFAEAIRAEAPPLARIEGVAASPGSPSGLRTFLIDTSGEGGDPSSLLVPPDVAMCDACAAEMRDPTNRRYRYPFITCTDCGPRYTLIDALPYDRERTSMRAFAACEVCQEEYETPGDRRHHSETNSCPECGPRVWMTGRSGAHTLVQGGLALEHAAALLDSGGVLALRGIGGFHLVVDACNGDAVGTLRARKRREAKPLALMVRTVAEARRLAVVTPEAERWLTRRERPIVLLPRRADAAIAGNIAPGLAEVGVMLAYSPLHHVLLDLVDRPLVMTSGNLTDEPIAATIDDARARLADIADAFLLHDREILARIDDSVVRLVEERPIVLRRARGFAPLPLRAPVAAERPVLAVGAQLKGTFTLLTGTDAYVSPHLGDLDSLETVTHFRESFAAYSRLFRAQPALVARDLHPGYLSTRLADELAGDLELPAPIEVQHHHAHIAAVMGEHGQTEPVIGLAFDGTGYGTDGTVWGGEVLLADLTGFQRLAHLRPAPLPGGDAAVRAPWRTVVGYSSLDPVPMAAALAAATLHAPPAEVAVVHQQCERRLNTPLHSSLGRLFDAAAAVLGIQDTVHYEGEAAMRLEALADAHPGVPLPLPVGQDEEGTWVIDPVPLLAALAARRAAGDDVAALAAGVHDAIVESTTALVLHLSAAHDVDVVALGGGCFQNARLLTDLSRMLRAAGLRVLEAQELPPNDGAISYGQAVIAAARCAAIVADAAATQASAAEMRDTEGVACV